MNQKAYNNEPIIIGVSGGKDSLATILHLRDIKANVIGYIYADTGWEHSKHREYLEYLQHSLGFTLTMVQAKIDIKDAPVTLPDDLATAVGVNSDTTKELIAKALESILGFSSPMVRRILKYGSLPAGHRRWCTSELKVKPIVEWWDEHAPDDAIYATGVRRSESVKRANYKEWEEDPVGGYMHWRPLIDWSLGDVVARIEKGHIEPNECYKLGATRVGCWPCIRYSKESLKALNLDPKRIEVVSLIEDIISVMNGKPPGWGISQKPGVDGKFYPLRIVELVEWAKTARGGKQMIMFNPPTSCSRWGWCDS